MTEEAPPYDAGWDPWSVPTMRPCLSPVREKDFQQTIVDAARVLGWLVYHPYDSRRSAPGFPDLVLARGDRLIFWEVKTERGVVTNAQTHWLDRLSGVPGVIAGVVRPGDWDQIEATLKGNP